MHNKKSLLALGAVVVLAIVGGLFYMTMGKAKAYVGKWEPKDQTGESRSTLELTKDEIKIEGVFKEEGKSATIKISAKYKEVEAKDNSYTLEANDPQVDITGDALDDEMKKSLIDSTKESIKKDNKMRFKLSDDKKELTEIGSDGSTKDVYKKL